MAELKPCPFCGGKAELIRVPVGYFIVECKECGLQFRKKNDCYDWADIVEPWNTRTLYKESQLTVEQMQHIEPSGPAKESPEPPIQDPALVVGPYTITKHHFHYEKMHPNSIYIYHSGGEGGEFNLDEIWKKLF